MSEPTADPVFKPLYMKNVDLILGDASTGPNFKCQLRSVTLTPDTNIAKTKTLCPTGQYAEVEDPEWELDLGYLYGTVTGGDGTQKSLADFLLANSGKKLEFVFRPISGGTGYGGMVTIVPGGIGGEQGNFSEQSVKLPLDGQPKPLPAA